MNCFKDKYLFDLQSCSQCQFHMRRCVTRRVTVNKDPILQPFHLFSLGSQKSPNCTMDNINTYRFFSTQSLNTSIAFLVHISSAFIHTVSYVCRCLCSPSVFQHQDHLATPYPKQMQLFSKFSSSLDSSSCSVLDSYLCWWEQDSPLLEGKHVRSMKKIALDVFLFMAGYLIRFRRMRSTICCTQSQICIFRPWDGLSQALVLSLLTIQSIFAFFVNE